MVEVSVAESLFDHIPEATKRCVLCATEYPASHFANSGRGGPFKRCETCRAPEGTRRERNLQMSRDTARRRNLRRLYNITPEEYDALRAAQEYRCAICQRHEDEIPARKVGRPRLDGKPITEAQKLHVDHDHHTDHIRGLLCGWCNSGLAGFQDQVDRMAAAIAYLTRN